MRSDPPPPPAGADTTAGDEQAAGGAWPAGAREAADLARARGVLLAVQPGKRRLPPDALRTALADLYDFWLTARAATLGLAEGGMALVAVGALGRRELAPHSDLDLMLLHGGNVPGLAAIADRLWYPLWDAGIGLDHSVRTVGEAVRVAGTDLRVALGLLQARHLAGDPELTERLVAATRQAWRAGLRGRLDELESVTRDRWRHAGEIAHRVQPDLKSGRGGLLDVQLIDAMAVAQVAGRGTAEVATARSVLLDVRTELHLLAGRRRDVLHTEDAGELAAALGMADRFELARALSGAARSISYATDVALRSARAALPRRGLAGALALRSPWSLGRLARAPLRRPLDDGVVAHAGEVALARDAQPTRDHALVLRVAAAAARSGLPIAAGTLARLAGAAPELREPWPRSALDELLSLLGAGPRAVEVVEALDRTGLWGRLLPEWAGVRDLPPREPAHVWTVDRHLLETVAEASRLTTRVARPDLLLLAALLHDIGKGRGGDGGGDHSVAGEALATRIGRRLGLWPADVATLSAVVRHHLLLPHTATRRDLADEATVRRVTATLDGDAVVLELLHALAEADALATGPGVWSDWKSALVGELVLRCRAHLAGDPVPARPQQLDDRLAGLATAGGVRLLLDAAGTPPTVTVVAPDRPGLLSRAAGVLALHSLQVHSAAVRAHGATAVDVFEVSPRFGALPDPALLRESLVRSLDGTLPLAEALDRKERDYAAAHAGEDPPPASVLWFDDEATGAVVLELRTHDRIGLLHRVAAALEACSVDIRWAKAATMGSAVVDSFCLAAPPAAQAPSAALSPAARRRIEHAVRAAAR